ncbi:MAG: hypothetical protein ACJA1G_001721 [Qipengyuania sp.]|jgi:hypothetical protein
MGELNAPVMADKQCRADLILKVTHAATDGGLVDPHGFCRPPEAPPLGGRNHVAKVSKLHRYVASIHLARRRLTPSMRSDA